MNASIVGIRGFRAIVEAAPDGFFIHDAQGQILDVNARSCLDLGYSRRELLALTISDISRGATSAENIAHWRAMAPGTAATIQEVAVRKDGSTYPVEVSLSCQLVRGRKLFMGLGRDVSEQETSRRALQTLNSELDARVARRTQEVSAAHAKLQAVMDSAYDVIVFQDREGRFQMFNRAAERLTGFPQDDALGKDTLAIFGAELGRHLKEAEEVVLATGKLSTIEQAVVIKGEERIFLITRTPHRNEEGTIIGLVGIGHDITHLRRSEQAVRRERDRLSLAAKVGGLGVWDYDLATGALQCDAQCHRVMGLDPTHPLQSIEDVQVLLHPEDAVRVVAAFGALGQSDGSGMFESVYRIVSPDGGIRWIRSAASLAEEAAGSARRAVGFIADITQAQLAEDALLLANRLLSAEKDSLHRRSEAFEKAAGEDPLTGIANRRRFDVALDQACRHASRTGEPLALAMIDVDHFKLYNDRYGHAQGDKALRAVAEILAWSAHRPYDLAARYGGEEFVLLLPGADRPEVVLESIIAQLAKRKLPHAGSPVSSLLTISCGCVVMMGSRLNAATSLAEADKALYRAKEAGRNQISIIRKSVRRSRAPETGPSDQAV